MTAAPEGELERQHVRRLVLAAILAYPTASAPNGLPGRPTEIPTPRCGRGRRSPVPPPERTTAR
jgi:hypothetical protein